MAELKVACVIVTYNRRELLSRCLEAVLKQSYPVTSIYIIDNASTDGTFEYLVEKHLVSKKEIQNETVVDVSIGESNIKYYKLSSNEGGAGGFYTGLKLAHETNEFDAFWLMDDDGYPSDNCLQKEMKFLSQYNYVMPVSIDIENHKKLSWATKKKDNIKTEILEELRNDWGEIMPFIFPFNGSLLSKKIVDEVGYINPKLFIWGDDYEHYYRCLKHGFSPVTILSAEFYHPVNKAPTVPICFGLVKIPYVESDLRFVCLIRNWAYIDKCNRRYLHLLKSFLGYSWLFLFTQKFNLQKYRLFLGSFTDGLKNRFDRHKKFLK